MPEKLDMSQLYAASLPAKNKQNLLAIYKDYISLVRNLEYVVKKYRPSNLAGYQIVRTYGEKTDENPWSVENISPEEKEAYLDFVNNKPVIGDNHYCFVSINHTSPNFKSNGNSIISTPDNYAVHSYGQSLPTRVERYIAAYQKDETLQAAEFLIAGRWKMKYNHQEAPKSLQDAFEDENIEKCFTNMIEVLTLFPEGKSHLSEQELVDAQTEALASALINPFENVLLSSLTSLSEESNKVVKKLLGLRAGENYMIQAEKEGLIPSAAVFQDYQNIRHLMHHQWDTLDGLGKFNSIETIKNTSVRRRYMDSYCRLCDKPLVERVKAYAEVAQNMSTLVSTLNPNLLIREKNESNSKFMTRAKQYAKDHPNEKIMLETNYEAMSDKKEALLKNISKVLPQAEVIDLCGMEIEKFLERISVYLYRKNYLEIFQQIEYKMSQHCLFYGKNIPPSAVLTYFRNCKMMSKEDADRWSEYKQLRNDLSHQYLNEDLIQRLENLFPKFMADAIKMEDKIDAQSPVVSLLHDNIYRAYHKNGKMVDIDYANRTIVNIEYPTSKPTPEKKPNKRPAPYTPTNKKQKNIYMEEYANGIRIGVNKTDIVSCSLPNGIVINLAHKNIFYPDGSRLYFNSNEHICLTMKGGVKLLTDMKMRLLNYINDGKSITVTKNENIKFPNGHSITINKKGYWEKEEFVGNKGEVIKIKAEPSEQGMLLKISDGTTIAATKDGLKVIRNNAVLSYATRKAFVESFSKKLSVAEMMQKKKGQEK